MQANYEQQTLKKIVPSKENTKVVIRTMILVWLSWFFGNLGSNALFYIGNTSRPELRWVGEIMYFVTISIVGIIVPRYYLREWKIEQPKSKIKKSWIIYGISFLFLGFLLIMGYFALEEQILSESLTTFFENRTLTWIISPIFNLIPTMIAYTYLWYKFYLLGIEQVLLVKLQPRIRKVFAIVLSSFIYSIYHFASIDEIFTLNEMLDEIGITFIISLVIASYVIFTNQIFIAFLGNLMINWFVFTPVDTFHTSTIKWIIPYLILGICFFTNKIFEEKKKNRLGESILSPSRGLPIPQSFSVLFVER